MIRHFIRHESGRFYNYLTRAAGPHVAAPDDALSWPTADRAATTAADLTKSAKRGRYSAVTLQKCGNCPAWNAPGAACNCLQPVSPVYAAIRQEVDELAKLGAIPKAKHRKARKLIDQRIFDDPADPVDLSAMKTSEATDLLLAYCEFM